MRAPNIAVYAGTGSSHSWTWLADLFETVGVYNVRFLDAGRFVEHLGDCSAAVISGGDGLSIASALEGGGFARLKDFISSGGLYVGICAGAYLPLPSSMHPFSDFNISTTKIENIDCRLDQIDSLPPRVAVRYGSCAVVHPVRGELVLDYQGRKIHAPLYGGPIFRTPEKDEVILRYEGFTDGTVFQFGRNAASSRILGKVAAVKAAHGSGSLLLFGPHLEHPKYPDANRLFLGLLHLAADGPVAEGRTLNPSKSVASALADLKVAVLGLENRSFVVGKKLWDSARYLELHNAIAKRARSFDNDLSAKVASALMQVRASLVGMSMGNESDVDDTTQLLVETAREVVDNHFQILVRRR